MFHVGQLQMVGHLIRFTLPACLCRLSASGPRITGRASNPNSTFHIPNAMYQIPNPRFQILLE